MLTQVKSALAVLASITLSVFAESIDVHVTDNITSAAFIRLSSMLGIINENSALGLSKPIALDGLTTIEVIYV